MHEYQYYVYVPFEVLGDVLQAHIYPELWAALKVLFAQWTMRPCCRIPEVLDAFQAEIMATWDGDRVGEAVPTDDAQKLLLSERRGHFLF